MSAREKIALRLTGALIFLLSATLIAADVGMYVQDKRL